MPDYDHFNVKTLTHTWNERKEFVRYFMNTLADKFVSLTSLHSPPKLSHREHF